RPESPAEAVGVGVPIDARLERLARHALVGVLPGRLQQTFGRRPELPDFLQVRAHDLHDRRALDGRLDALPFAAHGDREALRLREREDGAVAVLRDRLEAAAAGE